MISLTYKHQHNRKISAKAFNKNCFTVLVELTGFITFVSKDVALCFFCIKALSVSAISSENVE